MVAGRPIEFDPSEAVVAAMRTFWAKGYEATSMQDLLVATGLSKSSLYQTFGGKQKLFGRCIVEYTDQMVEQLRDRLESSASGMDFIRATLHEIATEGERSASPWGCLVMNTASEFGRRDAEFAQWVDAGIARVRSVMLQAVKRGQAEGEISTAHTASGLADYLMSSVAGLRTMVKAGMPARVVVGVVNVVAGALH